MSAPLSLSSALTFGKYKGMTVQEIIAFNPNYLAWAVKNVPGFDLDKAARKAGQREINLQRHNNVARQDAWARGLGAWAKDDAEKETRRRAKAEVSAEFRVKYGEITA